MPRQRKRPATVSRPELLQSGKDDRFRRMMHDLLSVGHRLQENRASHGRMLGMSGVRYTILTAIAYLQGGRGIPISDVARHVHLSPTFVTMETARLVEAGIVTKKQDSKDRRRVRVMLSARGTALLHSIVPIQRPVNDAMFANLSSEDFASFARIIGIIADNGEQAQALLRLLKLRISGAGSDPRGSAS